MLWKTTTLYHIYRFMRKKDVDLRKILALNIKIHRNKLGMSQEKLAEKAEISVNMVKDIEGCRTWVSDKTLIKLAFALKTDIYRLFLATTVNEDEIHKALIINFLEILKKIKKDVVLDVDNALKNWDVE